MTNAEQVERYIAGVLDGSIVAGRLVKLAVRRHVLDLEHAAERGYVFDDVVADEACDFFPEVLRHSTGQWVGEPFELTPWQKFCVWCLFGWRRAGDGMRRFRKAYVSVARKNGKTTLCAGLALLLLTFDNPIEHGAQIYVAATKEDQANIMHAEACSMVSKSPSLAKLTTVNKKNIAVPRFNSYFRPLGSDSKTNAGWNPHAVFLDELCDWQEHHRGLWGALTTASGARRQPLRMAICTAGDDESNLWAEEDEFGCRVLESVITGQIVDDSYFAFVARIDDERACECDGGCDKCGGTGLLAADDPMDETCWAKANPNLGETVQLDFLREQANEAKHKPTAMHDFVRYHLNRRVTSSVKAITPEAWAKCNQPLTDWSGLDSYGAFDLGWESDLASITVVCKVDEVTDSEGTHGVYESRSWSFICQETDRDLTREPWATFIRLGCLTVTPGSTTDVMGTVVPRIVEITDQYNVVQWAFDPSNARAVSNLLESEYGMQVYKYTQSHAMYNESLRCFLKTVRDRTLRHGGDPLLAWTAGNLTISKAKGAQDLWMPDKRKSREKIDPVVALIMAMGGAMNAPITGNYWNPRVGV